MATRICVLKGDGTIGPRISESFARAFAQLGAEVVVLDAGQLSRWAAGGDTQQTMDALRAIAQWRPQLAVCYGHTGFIWLDGGAFFRQIDVPLALLHFDCPFFVQQEGTDAEIAQNPDHYYHFIWDRVFLDAYRAARVANCAPIMLAADPSIFQPLELAPRFDVSFVGRAGDVAPLRAARRQRWSPEVNALIEAVIARKLAAPGRPTLDIWAELAAQAFPGLAPDWHRPDTAALYQAIHFEGSPLLRQAIVQEVRGVTLDVFGADWPGAGVRRHDEVDYAKELPYVYGASRINLNVTSLQLEQAVNNRIFDVAAAGAFLLTDQRQDLQDVFAGLPDVAAITYATTDELSHKIEHFLAHERERQELAHELCRVVHARHTYAHRAAYVLETVRR